MMIQMVAKSLHMVLPVLYANRDNWHTYSGILLRRSLVSYAAANSMGRLKHKRDFERIILQYHLMVQINTETLFICSAWLR